MLIKAGVELDESLKPGAAGEIELQSKNRFALRIGLSSSASSALGSSKLLTGDGAPPAIDQLRDALQKNLARVIDLFREWDDDGNGTISKREFRLALPMIGLQGLPPAVADELFGTFDKDKSGTVDYSEISRALRPKPVPGVIRKTRSHPRLQGGLMTGEQDYKHAMAAQLQAQKRLARIQKELMRAASTSALEAKREEKRLAAMAIKRTTEELVGRGHFGAFEDGPPASDIEVSALAMMFHKCLGSLFPGPTEQRSWFKLFHLIDEDRSGRISFLEFSKMVRTHLGIPRAELPEAKLRALWKALDEDSSGFISAGEVREEG